MRKKVEDLLAGRLPPPPVAQALGFRMVRCAGGEAEFRYTADGRHANPMGTLHGGILCDIVDAAMGMALASTLEEGESFTTLQLGINFLRPVWNAELAAKGRVVSRGRTVALVAGEVLDAQGRAVAAANATQMVLRGEQAQGR